MPHLTSFEIVVGCTLVGLITFLNVRVFLSRKKIERTIISALKENRFGLSEDEIGVLFRQRTNARALVEALPKLGQNSLGNPALDKMDKLLQEAEGGYADFVCPIIMKTGVYERVTAEIYLSKHFFDVAEDKSSVTEILVANVMSANLNGGSSFEINKLHSERQIIDKSRKTIWKWDVKPVKKGKHKMILLLSANLKISNSLEGSFDIPLFEKEINVNVNVAYGIKTFFAENWQWLIGSVLGTGVLWTILKVLKMTN